GPSSSSPFGLLTQAVIFSRAAPTLPGVAAALFSPQADLREPALDLLLVRESLAQQAAKRGLAGSDPEVDAELHDPTLPGQPAFRKEPPSLPQADGALPEPPSPPQGDFDPQKLDDYVAHQVHAPMRDYREGIRRQLLAKKMAGSLAGSLAV